MDNLLIKFKEKIAKNIGKNPKNQNISQLLENSIINIDKDCGPTSQQIVVNLKNILNLKKAGHSGTLDPKVTGVLVVGLGKATRLMEYMLKSNKEYVCLMYLHTSVDEDIIRKTFKKFTGKIMQTPPIVSAVKRVEREREIYLNKISEISKNKQNVLFRCTCQHGTYMRKLCTDMAKDMGTLGQMIELRRTKAGPFKEDMNIVGLDKLRNLYELYLEEEDKNKKEILELELKKYIRPAEDALKDFKKVYLRNSAVNSICHGADLGLPGLSLLDDNISIGEEIAMLTLKGELIGMGTAYLTSKQAMKKKKGAFIKTNKILMDTNNYPKYWEFEENNQISK